MRYFLFARFFVAGVISGYAQLSSKGIFESPYELETDSETFYDDDTTRISYRALGAGEFFILIYSGDKRTVHRYQNLKNTSGAITMMPYTLKAGSYTCALAVNGREVFTKE